jgi:uncharacterized protein
MRKQIFKRILSLLFLFSVALLRAAGDDNIPDPPSPPRLVNDLAGILSAGDGSTLETKLVNFNRQTSNQIAIVIVNDLGGDEISKYSFKLGRKWGIGQEKLRNGILIVIKPKTASSRGQAFIATGKGLEGAIPDATCHEIVDNEMIPHFKENDYYGGLNAATDVLMSLAKGEYDYNTYSKQNDLDTTALIFMALFILIIFFSIYRRIRRIGNRSYTMGGGGFFPFIGGGWGGGSSGGSSNGGGFGGFGGGDFGGGGSGGSW